jgi:hypothetical protein
MSVEDLEKFRAEIEARSRLELNQKLDAVNKFLQKQREEQEALDRLRDETEKDLRREFEKHKKELLVWRFSSCYCVNASLGCFIGET